MNTHNKLLTYALDKSGFLTYIEDVANGLSCDCICPCCKEQLIAKNGGKYRKPHFAHSSGSNCQGYYETTLHLLAKEVIKTEKSLMLPVYGKLEPRQIQFEEVEVEERNDSSSLQPDCVGVASDGLRLHIEIFVTHQIDDYKKSKIKEGNINCIEIKIPRDFPLDKELLQAFIVDSTESREWINYPYGEWLYSEKQKEQIIAYRNKHPEFRALHIEKCDNCKICSEIALIKYKAFISSYKGRIHKWAIPIAELSPKEIIYRDLDIRYTMKGKPYIWFNNRYRWIYPENAKFDSPQHEWICNSTYGFFKKLLDQCMNYSTAVSNHESCEHFKEKFEYQGQWYVFCDYKDHS